MARGKKHSPETKENAIQLYGVNGSISETARTLGVPFSTVKGWIDNPENSEEVAKVREEKRIEFAEKAGEIIQKGLKLLDRRISTALEHEEDLDKLLEQIAKEGGLNAQQVQTATKKIQALQVQKLGDITTAVGTLYDKRALARGEATANTAVTITEADRALLEKLSRRLEGSHDG